MADCFGNGDTGGFHSRTVNDLMFTILFGMIFQIDVCFLIIGESNGMILDVRSSWHLLDDDNGFGHLLVQRMVACGWLIFTTRDSWYARPTR